MRRRGLLAVSVLVPAMVLSCFGTAYASRHTVAPAPPPLPGSIAAIGDSISRGFDACCWFGEYPQYSWSTGSAQDGLVVSHYQRILLAHPAISGHAFDDAVVGAHAADTPAQAVRAVQQRAQYVTVLIGANDVCTSGIAAMTPTAQFQASVAATMEQLESGLPHAHIFVSSIPNVYQLWSALHTNPVARLVWALARICPSMLSEFNGEADRQTVVRQEAADNAVLAATCRRYANCRWDDLATFNNVFTAGDVSGLDYFHPSRAGQERIASETWAHSWWPGTA